MTTKSYQAGALVFNVPTSMTLTDWTISFAGPKDELLRFREHKFENPDRGDQAFKSAYEEFWQERSAQAQEQNTFEISFDEDDLSGFFNGTAKFFTETTSPRNSAPDLTAKEFNLFLRQPEGCLHFSQKATVSPQGAPLDPAETDLLFQTKKQDFLAAVKSFLPAYQWAGSEQVGPHGGFKTRYGWIIPGPDQAVPGFQLSFEHQFGRLNIQSRCFPETAPEHLGRFVQARLQVAGDPEIFEIQPELTLKPVRFVGKDGYELVETHVAKNLAPTDESESGISEFALKWIEMRPGLFPDAKSPLLLAEAEHYGVSYINETAADREEFEREVAALRNIWQAVIDKSYRVK